MGECTSLAHLPLSSSPPPTTFYLVGPTASGKTALALALAAQIDGEIVNADAFQLYRGLDIITAKPTPQERSQVPHHLFDVLDPTETCDAQRYRDLALPVLQQIAARGHIPIVVGGSGLYLKALTHGLDPLPPGDPALRAEFATLSLDEKVARLLALDPAAVENVPLQNPRYVERALEICLLTGQPQSTLRTAAQRPAPVIKGSVIVWDRPLLHQRIDQRVHQMIAAGAVQEVAASPALSTTSAKAIGVREIQAHLQGQLSLAETITQIQAATRQYAKRQITWFRRETCFTPLPLQPTDTAESIATHLRTHHHV
jgi:tRNA dimethylallyltransferase